MKVKYLDNMGDDLSVVNAARVSFGKRVVEKGYHQYVLDGYYKTRPFVSDRDIRLIKYLAAHGHWTPFAHTCITFHVSAPIFVARQLAKHQVGLVWNEMSRRYVDKDVTFYTPDAWRAKAENKKQGSHASDLVEVDDADSLMSRCLDYYRFLIGKGVAPEQARIVLPQSMYTEWFWSGSLYAFSRMCKLRLATDAQQETGFIAKEISDRCDQVFPVCWNSLL